MTYRDYVIAQIKHKETDYIPYELRLAGGVPEKLTEFYGSDSWRKELHWPIATAPSFFDSWDTQRWIDPSEPNKTIDAYGKGISKNSSRSESMESFPSFVTKTLRRG